MFLMFLVWVCVDLLDSLFISMRMLFLLLSSLYIWCVCSVFDCFLLEVMIVMLVGSLLKLIGLWFM